MTQGQTGLVDSCRYLVRRPTEIFLQKSDQCSVDSDQEKSSSDSTNTESLSQEELLKQPVYIPFRPIKDPREIRMLDPACGSMHFGLYAFDLFEQIYEEAWHKESQLGAAALARSQELEPLQATFANFEDFKAQIPKLIIEHNIHGVDIDPRAVQIAGLSLWQRAQRSWQQQGVKPQDRPRITKSNIVCAEPMPGEKDLLQEFSVSLNPPVLGQLLEVIFDKMQLAGEAGTLLKIEVEIQQAIQEAREQWQQQKGTTTDLFPAELKAAQRQQSLFDLSGIDDVSFWENAEELILQALSDYAEQAEIHAEQKRLFAEDAAKGFAFIDLCRKRFDVVLMNPPFGSPGVAKEMLNANYPNYCGNLLCAFLIRAVEQSLVGGAVAAITDRTWLQKTSYEPFRNFVFSQGRQLRDLGDLGWGILDDAQVETAMQVISICHYESSQLSVIDARLIANEEKQQFFEESLRSLNEGTFQQNTYVRKVSDFSHFPDTSISYWCLPTISGLISSSPTLDPSIGTARVGLQAGDTARAFRLNWEVSPQSPAWQSIQNGGDYSPFYRDSYLRCLNANDFAELRLLSGARLQNLQFSKKAGLTWGKRTDFLAPGILPSGQLFSNEGHSAQIADEQTRWVFLCLLNSRLFQYTINLFCGQHKGGGYVGKLPAPELEQEILDSFEDVGRTIFNNCRTLASYLETDSNFSGQVFLSNCVEISNLAEILEGEWSRFSDTSQQILEIHDEIDRMVFNALLVPASERQTVYESTKTRPTTSASIYIGHPLGRKTFALSVGSSLIQLLLGHTFGLWDIRYTTGERKPPELPDPFDQLPVCPPGMLQNAEGWPAEPRDVPTDYPLRVSWAGILVDDENHPEDIAARVREAIKVIWKDRSEAIEQEVCETLEVKSLRDYFCRPSEFFDDHLKRYSKSRRQAPIYWPLQTLSGSYTLWVYYHRLTEQTLYTCVNDFVEPKLRQIQAEITALKKVISGRWSVDSGQLSGSDHRPLTTEHSKTTDHSKNSDHLSSLIDLEHELTNYRDELLRIAKFWKPNLNDGVQITAAPLWKLFQHKAWQKKLKETWQKLEHGDYDWAHLAYSIWPERVLRKCLQDRSLAIAHDVENDFWEEVEVPVKRSKKATSATKLEWRPKELSASELTALIQQKIAEQK